MRKIDVIVAVDDNWGIGRNNDLLVRLSGDLKYFKEKTMGATIVMGRNTFESLPGRKPLPGRNNVILTRSYEYAAPCKICHSEDLLLEYLEKLNKDEKIFIIGGEKMYREFLPLCSICYVTKISATLNADRFFVNLDEDDKFELVWESEEHEENGVRYKFTKYQRKG